jgi:hypothetical protein
MRIHRFHRMRSTLVGRMAIRPPRGNPPDFPVIAHAAKQPAWVGVNEANPDKTDQEHGPSWGESEIQRNAESDVEVSVSLRSSP